MRGSRAAGGAGAAAPPRPRSRSNPTLTLLHHGATVRRVLSEWFTFQRRFFVFILRFNSIKGKSVMQNTAQQRSPDLSPLVTVVPHRHPAPTSGTHLSLQAHPEFPVTPAPLSLQHPCSLFPVTVPHVLLHPSASLLPPFGLGLQQYMFLLSLPPPSPSLPRPGSAPPRHFLTWRISGQQCARACTLTRDPRGPRILLLSTV